MDEEVEGEGERCTNNIFPVSGMYRGLALKYENMYNFLRPPSHAVDSPWKSFVGNSLLWKLKIEKNPSSLRMRAYVCTVAATVVLLAAIRAKETRSKCRKDVLDKNLIEHMLNEAASTH